MMKNLFSAVACASVLTAFQAVAEVEVLSARNTEGKPGYRFERVPRPSKDDAAADAEFALVEGRRDRNGGGLDKLHDGFLPSQADEPLENFFFAADTEGGRIRIDLGEPIDVAQVNTYSWHPTSRGPQVYKLYGSDGAAEGFNAEPADGTDPVESGWKLLAEVDTREEGQTGGQYGVSVRAGEGNVGRYRYLFFDVARTDSSDPFGNTFYSEIDVVAAGSTPMPATGVPRPESEIVEVDFDPYHIRLDVTEAPELAEWIEAELVPVVREWYPKLVEMLPGEGFEAPRRVTILFDRDMRGVAAASGTRIRVSVDWFGRNLDGEARGCIVHELVHVVQQYGRARRGNRNPGWLVEGLADYIRWFLYEPESRGAEITNRNLERASHDGSYRISANFLDWVVAHHGAEIIPKLNASMRAGQYTEDLWTTLTGRSLNELGAAWKTEHEERITGEARMDREWRTLPLIEDGQPSPAWEHIGYGGFVVDDGALRTECDPKGLGLLVYGKERFGNCQVRVVYKSEKPSSNAGVYVRIAEGIFDQVGTPGAAFERDENGSPSAESLEVVKASAEREEGPWYAVHQGYEVQITDAGDSWHRTGSIYSLAESSGAEGGQPGEWRTMIITLKDKRILVELDGERTTTFDPGSPDLPSRKAWHEPKREPERPVLGYLGLQNHDPGDVVWFKDVSVRPLPVSE